jgi:magnesium transporter
MQTDIVTANVQDDQEAVAEKVAFYNLSAIPVVDDQRHMVGIITHDDVIDVMRQEATEDVQRISAMEPLSDSYMRTSFLTLSWKRGMWLAILFFTSLLTAFALQHYNHQLSQFPWLIWFLPLIISSGGNSGSQSATLIITGLATKELSPNDGWKVLRREFFTGLLLGGFLGAVGLLAARSVGETWYASMVIPLTILSVVTVGTSLGSILPLLLQKIGVDPALMSNPLIAGISDILGIVIYLNIALFILT